MSRQFKDYLRAKAGADEKAAKEAAAKKALEIEAAGKKLFEGLLSEMERLGYSRDEADDFAALLVRLSCGADNVASKEEYELFGKVTGVELSIHEFYDLIKGGDEEAFVASMDEIVDGLDAGARKAALDFVKFFLDADEKLPASEGKLLARLAA